MKLPWAQKTGAKETSNLDKIQFESLIQNLGDGVIIYTPNFRITYINSTAEKIVGVKQGELNGIEISPNLIQNPNFKILAQIIFPSIAPLVTQISESGWPEVVDINLDDPAIKLRITTIKVIANNLPVNFIKIIRDRTREEAILESKKEFLDVAAHQLRTPVTAMSWAFETLLSSVKSDPNLEPIATEGLNLARRSLKIINDLLSAAQIESGRFGYSFQTIDIVSFVKSLIGEAKVIADRAGVKMSFSGPEQVINLNADPEHIGIAISNLIDNAIKYTMNGGSVTVSLDSVENSEFIKISISDTGVGIPQNEISEIFKKFYRGSNIVRLEPNGSGLGLYIVRNIIKNHGGEISVQSEIGRGTTFSITLPLNPAPQTEAIYDTEK